MLKTGVSLCLGLNQGRNTVNKRQSPTKETLSHSRKTDSLLWQKQKKSSQYPLASDFTVDSAAEVQQHMSNPHKDLRRSDLVKLPIKTPASCGVKTFALLKRLHVFFQQGPTLSKIACLNLPQ